VPVRFLSDAQRDQLSGFPREPYQHYHKGMEDQLGALGLVLVALRRLEVERERIDAVALASRGWTVIKDMAKVAATSPAGNFGPDHAMARVLADFHRGGDRGLIEARPARTRVELRLAVEKDGPTAGARVGPISMVVDVLARPRRLGPGAPEDL
jgi:hypothetical protein